VSKKDLKVLKELKMSEEKEIKETFEEISSFF
jgi:hypothetical protein